jgi:large conductance mechanosensitive channel
MDQRQIVRRVTDLKVVSDFTKFLLKQNILSLAIAVVVGAALGGLVKAMVDGFIMPIVGAVMPSGEWQTASWKIGPVRFAVGSILAAFVNFLIVAFVAWRLTKFFIKEDAAPPARACEFCTMPIGMAATRCPHCTSQLTVPDEMRDPLLAKADSRSLP